MRPIRTFCSVAVWLASCGDLTGLDYSAGGSNRFDYPACHIPDGIRSRAVDTTAPELLAIRLDRTIASGGDRVQGTLLIREAGCGLNPEVIFIRARLGFASFPWSVRTVVEEGAGLYRVVADFEVSPCHQPGSYQVSVSLADFADNSVFYTADENARTYDRRTWHDPEPTALTAARLEVRSEGAPMPRLNGVEATRIAGYGIEVWLRTTAGAPTCPIQGAHLTFDELDSLRFQFGPKFIGSDEQRLRVRIPDCGRQGRWALSHIRLTDSAGRTAAYRGDGPSYTLNGESTFIPVPVVELVDGQVDVEPPLVTNVAVDPRKTTNGTEIGTEVTLRDGGCGLRWSYLAFGNGAGTNFFTEARVESTRVAACTLIPACAPPDRYVIHNISMFGNDGNMNELISTSDGLFFDLSRGLTTIRVPSVIQTSGRY